MGNTKHKSASSRSSVMGINLKGDIVPKKKKNLAQQNVFLNTVAYQIQPRWFVKNFVKEFCSALEAEMYEFKYN